jgi:chemotaxis response regulator CheB
VPIRILVVDDSAVIREAVRSCIDGHTELEVCGEAENGDVALDMVRRLNPDIVVLDLVMPGHERIRGRTADCSDYSGYTNDFVHCQRL